jgi:hypothetical protein
LYQIYPLNKQPYGSLASKSGPNITQGVIFSTYASLIAQSDQVREPFRHVA